ncbi:MAG TPA: shikimate dehydrogenase [Candidatus Dormibacteraeota bacterium]|nr:shikimate dehydrogenase [Candidatus Dormibacteraeota bacterium]
MRVLLLGHPVAHSLSPPMQNAAFRAQGLTEGYEAVDVAPEKLADYVTMLRGGLYLGANVTVPHKTAAVALMDSVDREVETLGALNTIVARDGRLGGHNTDIHGAWEGLLAPVRDSLLAARLLLLGAGGGARALLAAVAKSAVSHPRQVVVCSRREEAAAEVAALGERLGLPCSTAPWWELREVLRVADIVVNCTPLGLRGEDPLEGIPVAGRVVLDMAYRPGGTPLFQRAWAEGSMALQGDGMLLHQGAEAFRLWTGLTPPVAAMRLALDEAMGRPPAPGPVA